MNSVVLVTGDEFSDVFVWDLNSCTDPEVEEGSSKLLLRTLTGHNGTVHSLQFTPTGLVTADVTGLIIVRYTIIDPHFSFESLKKCSDFTLTL